MKEAGLFFSRIHQAATVPQWMRLLLGPFSVLYGAGVRMRLQANALGLTRPRRLPGAVLSVGNLTAGGTGKTPAVCTIAARVRDLGHKVSVLSRGYKGKGKGIIEVSDGLSLRAGPEEAGDEPCLLARSLPGVPVVVCKDRYAAGRFALEHYGSEVFVLDDGFQHLALHRDCDIVLMDARRPLGNGFLLPLGPLREPAAGLRRAQALVLTRAKEAASVERTAASLRALCPGIPLFFADHVPMSLVLPSDGQRLPPEALLGRRVTAFAGIGRPEALEETLRGLGARILAFTPFPDHRRLSRERIQALSEKGRAMGSDYVLTTEKDWFRMEGLLKGRPGWGYLTVSFRILSDQEAFFDLLQARIRRRQGPG